MDATELKEFALKLRAEERAQLAPDLIDSLDELVVGENERLWLDEAERRYNAYKKGKIPAQLAGEVFKEAYARYHVSELGSSS